MCYEYICAVNKISFNASQGGLAKVGGITVLGRLKQWNLMILLPHKLFI